MRKALVLLGALALSCRGQTPPESEPVIEPQGLEAGAYRGEAHVTLKTKRFDEALRRVKAAAGSLGGYVVSVSVDEVPPRSASLVLAVPSERLYDFLDSLRALKGTRVTQLWVEHVRVEEALAQVEAKLSSKEALAKRLRELLAEAKTVSEAVEVERELAKVSEELDSLRVRAEVLRRRAKFSEVSVSLAEERAKGRVGLFLGLSLSVFLVALLLSAVAALVFALKLKRA